MTINHKEFARQIFEEITSRDFESEKASILKALPPGQKFPNNYYGHAIRENHGTFDSSETSGNLMVLNGYDKPVFDPSSTYFLAQIFEVGGVSGGSCWDSSNPRSYFSDTKIEFDQLDIILEKFTNISFVAYRRLCSDLVQDIEYSKNEYYGNRTDYRIKAINLKKLHDFLENENCFKKEYATLSDDYDGTPTSKKIEKVVVKKAVAKKSKKTTKSKL